MNNCEASEINLVCFVHQWQTVMEKVAVMCHLSQKIFNVILRISNSKVSQLGLALFSTLIFSLLRKGSQKLQLQWISNAERAHRLARDIKLQSFWHLQIKEITTSMGKGCAKMDNSKHSGTFTPSILYILEITV